MVARVLIVDDDHRIADSLCMILGVAGYEGVVTYSAFEALEQLKQTDVDLVITDVVMPGMNGVELATELKHSYPEIPVIILSGNAATEDLMAQAGDKIGPVTLIAKPCSPKDLIRTISKLTNVSKSAD